MVAINKEFPQQLQLEELIDLREYWRVFYSNKWAIFGFASLITLISALVVINITPVYRGTSTLLIETREANINPVQQINNLGGNEYLLTQFELLKSRTLAKKVILKHNLLDHPTFNEQESKLLDELVDAELQQISEESMLESLASQGSKLLDELVDAEPQQFSVVRRLESVSSAC